jgi:hypothetical protein
VARSEEDFEVLKETIECSGTDCPEKKDQVD